jgi:hypothetical protein
MEHIYLAGESLVHGQQMLHFLGGHAQTGPLDYDFEVFKGDVAGALGCHGASPHHHRKGKQLESGDGIHWRASGIVQTQRADSH